MDLKEKKIIGIQDISKSERSLIGTNDVNGENKINGEAMHRHTVRGLCNRLTSWKTRLIFSLSIYFLVAVHFFIILHLIFFNPISDVEKLKYSDEYKNLPQNIKFILLWPSAEFYPFYDFTYGQESFIKNECPKTNCYVTDNRNFFGGNLSMFHAIAFNARNLEIKDLPTERYYHQKYIYFQTESADNYPECKYLDGFFNWTATYRLNSDIPFPYLNVHDVNGKVVGPKINMQWNTSDVSGFDYNLDNKLQKKRKAAAWFVSNCNSRSNRLSYVLELQKALNMYGLTLDIFGKCGTKICPKEKKEYCNSLVQEKYYFYLAMENSFDEDYVTEKLLIALQNYAVPIVYGGANYSRFVPPNSYLSASVPPKKLAEIINSIIENPKVYKEYFRWHAHYTFHLAAKNNVCALCEILNDRSKFETPSVYKHLRKWWNPKFAERCEKHFWSNFY